MTWDHGYFSAIPYTCGYYRELAPAWLDLAALLKGHQPPRQQEGEPFRYLELGSGMGLGLCLLAAAYPEGQFLGIDFQPDHIVHSRRLAQQLGLTNVSFEEADFVALAAAPGALAGAHQYVAAHGIATWITAPVQAALLQLAATALCPGGLFYCSYNTYPGWLGASALQQLAEQLRQQHGQASSAEAVRGAARLLSQLLGSDEQPSALALALPTLRTRLERIPSLDPSYLVQEYINAGWQPLYVAEMHRRAAQHKLRFHASATLPENFLELLPANVQPAVLAEPDAGLRQSLQDLATNQSFRRDLFLRGLASCSASELQRQLGAVRLRLLEAPTTDSYRFDTSFGQVNGLAETFGPIEQALAQGPCSFRQLQATTQLPLAQLARCLALLLHGGRLGIDRGDAAEADLALRVNRVLRQLIREGKPYSHLVAPAIGGAVGFSLVEALLEEGQGSGGPGDPSGGDPSNPELAERLQRGLTDLGRTLKLEPAAAISAYRERRPRLQALGVLS